MSVSARYNHILIREGFTNLALARERRVRIRELTAQLRKRAEEQDRPDPLQGDIPQVQLMITNKMRQQLADLGWLPEDVKKMTPQQAKDIIDENFTKDQKEQSDQRREELLDAHEERILSELEKAKKNLAILQKKYEATEAFVDRLYDKLDGMESNSDGSEKAQEKLRHFEQMREDQERALNGLDEQIRAQNQMIQAIIHQEDGLIDDLQEVNETAISTPGPEDDQLLEERIRERGEVLSRIRELRKQLWRKDKDYQQAFEKLLKLRKQQEKTFDLPSLFKFNELEDEAERVQDEVDRLEKEVQSVIRLVMKNEMTLKTKKVEDHLQEIEDAYQDLPEFVKDVEALREESKKDVAEEDPGQDAASKMQFYKDRSEAISSFVQKYEPQFRDFVVNFIGPDIPSDDKIEKSLKLANQAIIKRALEMQKLAERYRRNDMQRSAILLPSVLYEVLAKNMQAVLDVEQGEAQKEAQALYDDLVEAGFLKEAISLKEVWDKTKSVGKDVGQGVGKAYQKGKELSEQASEALDRARFKSEDVGPRREFGKPLEEARKNLQQLVSAERELKQRLEEAQKLLTEASQEKRPDSQEISRIRDAIREMNSQLQAIGEQKNVLEQGLAHKPAPGAMRGQEQAARGRKSDYQHAVALMQEAMPDLVKFLALIPDDTQLEQELLRQSDRIAQTVNKLIQIAYKEKKRFPNLPPTIQAYGHMFLAIDDALDRALRSNEGITS